MCASTNPETRDFSRGRFITVLMLDEIINCMESNPTCNYVATTKDELLMPPVLFPASLFQSLTNLEVDTNARAVLRGIPQNRERHIPCKDKRFVFDVDTVDDYKELL